MNNYAKTSLLLVRYSERVDGASSWQAAGHETELHVFPEAPHGFDGFPTPAGMDATNRVNNFLSGCLG